jgi:hypothetical protein
LEAGRFKSMVRAFVLWCIVEEQVSLSKTRRGNWTELVLFAGV